METIAITEYITGASGAERIKRVVTILDSLEMAMIEGTVNLGKSGYTFDDGQMKVSTNFRSLDDIQKAYEHWLRVYNMLYRAYSGTGIVYTMRQSKGVGR